MRADRNERQYLADGGPNPVQHSGTHASTRSENLRNLIRAVVIVGGLILALIVLASFISGPAG